MSQAIPIASREAALRIALAARALDGLDVRTLVGALLDKLEAPLTERKLAALTVEDLRVLLAGDHADENCVVGVAAPALKAAVRLLWGEGVAGSDLPQAQPYTAGDLPNSIRVGVASNHGEQVDGHFGSCECFLVYQVSPTALRLIDVRSALEADTAEDRNAARAELVADCQILFVQSIGGPAAAKVVRRGIHPLKQPAGGEARAVLTKLQPRLINPPPWLARIVGVPAASLARYEEDALA